MRCFLLTNVRTDVSIRPVNRKQNPLKPARGQCLIMPQYCGSLNCQEVKMRTTCSKHLFFALAAIPIGAASGFACAAVVFSVCRLLDWFSRPSTPLEDIGLTWYHVIGVAVYHGASIGAAFLPGAYLLFLRHIREGQVRRVLSWLFFGVLVAGVLASPLRDFFSLVAAAVGFWIAVCYARRKTLVAS